MDKPKSEDIVWHQLRYAAAIAVLRAKPREADAYQYTKQLCTKYLQAQTQWRSRYLQAQEAVLHLKQQQTICMAQQSEESVCLPTPPSSASEETDGSSDQPVLTVTRQQALLSSYRFIHTVVSLARTLGTEESSQPSHGTDAAVGGPRPPHACPPIELLSRVDTLLTETVPSCVGHLKEVVSRGDTDVSTQCVMQGLQGLMLLLDADWVDSLSSGWHPRLLLLEQLSGLIDDLLLRLFELDSRCVIGCVRTRKLLHQMLLQLTTRMRAPEKFSLLHSVATHAKTLCAAMTCDGPSGVGGAAINPDCYDSLGIALDCLQQGIASVKMGDIHVELLKEIQQEMESVLDNNLIYRFPLVARTVLRLTSLIELCGKSEV